MHFHETSIDDQVLYARLDAMDTKLDKIMDFVRPKVEKAWGPANSDEELGALAEKPDIVSDLLRLKDPVYFQLSSIITILFMSFYYPNFIPFAALCAHEN